MTSTNFFTSGEAWASAIQQFHDGPESEVEGIVRQIFAKDCLVTIQGNKMTVDNLIDYIMRIRHSHVAVEVRSERWVRNGNVFAEKHKAIGHRNDSTITQGDVWVMGELNAEGKLSWFEEAVRLEEGDLKNELKG